MLNNFLGGDNMGICPNCGEWVDEGDICMCCGGGGSSEYDDRDSYDTYSPSYSPRYAPLSREEREKRDLERKKEMYERKLDSARSEENFSVKMRRYNEAVDYFNDYVNLSKRFGMDIEGMPRGNSALPDTDLQGLSKMHYDSQGKFALFGNYEKDELEKLLERSGNANVITSNKSRRNAELKSQSRKYRIRRAQELRKYYFEHIEKANGFVDEDNHKKAMKEYRRANSCWNSYFDYDYKKDPQKDEMPDDKFTSEAVEHMMVIYVKTHPILTSKKKQLKINREIVEMLDGKWDDKIHEADRKAQEILDERQRRKQEAIERVGEAIGDAMIFGSKIIERFRK
jgi:ribosomal protein L32